MTRPRVHSNGHTHLHLHIKYELRIHFILKSHRLQTSFAQQVQCGVKYQVTSAQLNETYNNCQVVCLKVIAYWVQLRMR